MTLFVVYGLIEADLRAALGPDTPLPGLLPEHRDAVPTARAVLTAFTDLHATYTTSGLVLDRLTPVQRLILAHLDIPLPWPETHSSTTTFKTTDHDPQQCGKRAYDTYLDVEHQLCCAHALARAARRRRRRRPDADWCWATQAADALVAMQKLVAEATAAGADAVDPDALAEQVRLYRSAAQIGLTQTSARSSTVMKKHNALARRLLDRQDDYLRFTTDWRIPADNNGSERDIRMIKLRQKVSGCLRTLTGAQQFCAIRSYLSTAAKHGRTFFDTLVMLAEGRPWMPAHN